MRFPSVLRASLIAVAAMLGLALSSAAHADSGTVRLTIYKGGWFIGGSGGSGTLTVQAGQFATTDEATAFAANLVGTLPSAAPSPAATGAPALPQTGQVAAAGTVTGSYTIVDGGDGTGIAVWSNGTGVFRLVAPLAEILNAYGAYPL